MWIQATKIQGKIQAILAPLTSKFPLIFPWIIRKRAALRFYLFAGRAQG